MAQNDVPTKARTAAQDSPDKDRNPAGNPPWVLLVVTQGAMETVDIHQIGALTIGRGEDADVQLRNAAVSKRHARIDLGPRSTVTDLGSTNGTYVHGERIAPGQAVEIQPGWSVGVGEALLMLQQAAVPAASNSLSTCRPLWPHETFLDRLTEECARSQLTNGVFGVFRIRNRAPNQNHATALIRQLVPPPHFLAQYGPAEFEAVLFAADDAGVDAAERTLRDRLQAVESVQVGSASISQRRPKRP